MQSLGLVHDVLDAQRTNVLDALKSRLSAFSDFSAALILILIEYSEGRTVTDSESEDPSITGCTVFSLARVHLKQGRLDLAEPLLLRALDIFQQVRQCGCNAIDMVCENILCSIRFTARPACVSLKHSQP